MKRRTRLVMHAACVLFVIGLGVLAIVYVLSGCTLVVIRGDGNAVEQAGGQEGWQFGRGPHDAPSLHERIFGRPAAPATPTHEGVKP